MKKKGFTLIELLVVIILIGLISLIVVPIVSDIISNSKKEAFKRSVEGLAREYEYTELSDNIILGEIDACSLQDTCRLQGIIKRDSEDNMYAYLTDGTYCINGKVSNMKVVNGTCGLNGEILSEITFNGKTITKDYEEVTKDIELEVSGGSSGYLFTKVSETKDGVNSDSILILNDGIIRIPAKTNAGEYDLVVKVLDNITQEEKEANIKIIINRIDITEITLNNIESVNYDGTEHEPEPAVVLKGKTLKKDIEFEYSYLNNKNAGEATVKVTGIGNYVGEITKTFTINRVNAVNTSIVGATLTYNTLNQSLVESVNISNSHVYYSVGTELNSSNYLTLGNETRPTRSGAGTYTVYYYAPADNYNEVSGSITSIINPKVLEIPVSPAVKTYNESFQDSGITCPTGSTESGSTSEINAGTYTQTCTLSSTTNYKWNDNSTTPKNISWTINKSNTGTTGNCNSLTYNTLSQTLMSGGSYVSYSNNLGTNAGSYNVTITTDNNHTFSDGDTSKTQTCTINPQTLTIPTSPQARSYTGGTLYSNITCPTGSNISGDTSAINAGSYTQTCTLSSTTNYKWNDNTTTAKNISWTINKSNTATLGSCNSLTYNTSSQTLMSGGSYVSYSNNSGINAGNYDVTISANSNYAFSDGTVSKTQTCTISPQTLTVPTSPAARSYTGGTLYSNITCPTGSNTSGTTSAINAGSYTQTCTLSSTTNYKWNDNSTTAKNISWVVNKLNTATTGSCIARTYTGSSQAIVSSGSYVSYSATTGVNAGSYSITVTSDNNHTFSDGATSKTLSCSINPQTLTIPTSPAARPYTGGTLYSNITCPTGSSASGTQSTVNAGTYTQTCTLSSTTNYKWNDNSTTAKNISWVVNKINPTMNLSSTEGTHKIGTNGSITVSGTGYGTLTCSSSNTSIASCSISGSTVTIIPVSEGQVILYITGSGGTNYNSITKTYTATVESAYIPIETCPDCKYARISFTYYSSTYNNGYNYNNGHNPSSSWFVENYRELNAYNFVGAQFDSNNHLTQVYLCMILGIGTSTEKPICISKDSLIPYEITRTFRCDWYNFPEYQLDSCSYTNYPYTYDINYAGGLGMEISITNSEDHFVTRCEYDNNLNGSYQFNCR